MSGEKRLQRRLRGLSEGDDANASAGYAALQSDSAGSIFRDTPALDLGRPQLRSWVEVAVAVDWLHSAYYDRQNWFDHSVSQEDVPPLRHFAARDYVAGAKDISGGTFSCTCTLATSGHFGMLFTSI